MTKPALDLFDDESLAEPVSEALRRLVIDGFHALWREQTLTVAELAAGDPTAVAAAVDHLRASGRIESSDDGRLVAVHGVARRATPHRIEHDDGAVNTWCALDAVGIPAAMGIDAQAVTQCPTCGQPLTVTLARGEPRPLPGAVLWYPEDRCAHLVDDFCSGANLFCFGRSPRTVARRQPDGWSGHDHRRGGGAWSGDVAGGLRAGGFRWHGFRRSLRSFTATNVTAEPGAPPRRRSVAVGVAAVLGCCVAHALIVGGVAASSMALLGLPAVLVVAGLVGLRYLRPRR